MSAKIWLNQPAIDFPSWRTSSFIMESEKLMTEKAPWPTDLDPLEALAGVAAASDAMADNTEAPSGGQFSATPGPALRMSCC